MYRDVTKCTEMYSDEGRMYRGVWRFGSLEVLRFGGFGGCLQRGLETPVHYHYRAGFCKGVLQGSVSWKFNVLNIEYRISILILEVEKQGRRHSLIRSEKAKVKRLKVKE